MANHPDPGGYQRGGRGLVHRLWRRQGGDSPARARGSPPSAEFAGAGDRTHERPGALVRGCGGGRRAPAMKISPLAGHPPPETMLLDVAKLVTAYYTEIPDPSVPGQRVAFGTSGHRGSSFENTFNEWHVLAISEAICRYRRQQGIAGPIFLGADTHALSAPASTTAVEVLAANGVDIMLAEHDAYTPTPAVSHAILTYNRERTTGLADGIVVTPSHNPPDNGGFKYNPPNGGPADVGVTSWMEARANLVMERGHEGLKR